MLHTYDVIFTSASSCLLGMSVLCEYAIAAYFSKVHMLHIFPHKLAFLTAILILFVFLLPISIWFRYLNHPVANRMAPSMCLDLCGTRWGSWFQVVLYHISAYFCHIFGIYVVHIFFKCFIKLACLVCLAVISLTAFSHRIVKHRTIDKIFHVEISDNAPFSL